MQTPFFFFGSLSLSLLFAALPGRSLEQHYANLSTERAAGWAPPRTTHRAAGNNGQEYPPIVLDCDASR